MTPNQANNTLRDIKATLADTLTQISLEAVTETELDLLDRQLVAVILDATDILARVQTHRGYARKPGTLYRRIRKVLGFTYP